MESDSDSEAASGASVACGFRLKAYRRCYDGAFLTRKWCDFVPHRSVAVDCV
jgi:hypothetical protein